MAISWGNNGTVTDFIFLGSKITADGDCSHEIKSCLLLGRKNMTNLDSILKSRGINLPTNVCLIKAMVFPVVMHGCECWTIKNVEHQRIDELWGWRRLLRVLDCMEIKLVNPKGNQPWVFLGRADGEVEVSILRPPNAKNWLFGKDPDAGKDWRQKEKETTENMMVGWHHRLDGHGFKQALVIDRKAWFATVHGVAKNQTQLSDWTELNHNYLCSIY